MNCNPKSIEQWAAEEYPSFCAERRKLIAPKIRTYFEGLCDAVLNGCYTE
jgi:hypothetical protein